MFALFQNESTMAQGDEGDDFSDLWADTQEDYTRSRRPARTMYSLRDGPMGQEAFVNVLKEDRRDFYGYLRMEENVYEMILRRLTPYIQKEDTNFKKAIPPNQRLLAALRFFITGQNLEQHRFETKVSPTCLRGIIEDVSIAIIAEFGDEYMKVSWF